MKQGCFASKKRKNQSIKSCERLKVLRNSLGVVEDIDNSVTMECAASTDPESVASAVQICHCHYIVSTAREGKM